jgi:hypothetical protein
MKFVIYKKLNFNRLLILIMLVSVIFILLQLFSLKSLNRTQNSTDKNDILMNYTQINLKNVNIPRGVHLKDAHMYQPDKEGCFTCINSKVYLRDCRLF